MSGKLPVNGGLWGSLLQIPQNIRNPYALAAVALVVAVPLVVFGAQIAALVSIASSAFLLCLGLLVEPKGLLARLIDRGARYTPIPKGDASQLSTHMSPLDVIYFLHLYQREGGGTFGYYAHFTGQYFLDLMEAALVRDQCETLQNALSRHIRSQLDVRQYSMVVGPKRGNTILTAAVAEELNLAPIFVRETPLFNRWLEGSIQSNKRAILIDDISCDGQFLAQCVRQVGKKGIQVDKAFVLVDRIEGNAATKLRGVGVTLIPLATLGDSDFERLENRARGELVGMPR